jgi:hypothetical protein
VRRSGRAVTARVTAVRRAAAVPAAALVLAALAACAGPDAGDARDTVDRFAGAVAAGDGETACALLVPDAADALAADAGAPCADAVVDPAGPLADVVRGTGDVVVTDVHVAGRQAQVVTDSDTLFLALSGEGWVVTAAGCTPREDRPYDCEVAA